MERPPRRGERSRRLSRLSRPSRGRSRPESNRQEADGGVRAHCPKISAGCFAGPSSQAYLNLQQIVAANALIVHLMVGIICVTTAFVFDEGETADTVRHRQRGNMDRFARHTDGWQQCEGPECHSERGVRIYYRMVSTSKERESADN